MFMIDYTGRVILVIGAGTGIGAAIARAFNAAGADLAISYHGSQEGARRVAQEVEDAGHRCLVRGVDSRSVPEIEAMVDETVRVLGTIDVLVYNAGLTDPHPLFELTEEQWDRTLDINLKGMFFCARRVAAHMRDRRRPGSIVLLSSVHSIQALARQLAPLGIRVNAIAPGSIYVERHRDEHLYDPEEMGKKIPLGRVGRPEEIADVAVYLASDRASYVTGHVLFADGGLTLPLHLH